MCGPIYESEQWRIPHNDTQHKGLISDIQDNDTQHNDTAIMLSVTIYLLLC